VAFDVYVVGTKYGVDQVIAHGGHFNDDVYFSDRLGDKRGGVFHSDSKAPGARFVEHGPARHFDQLFKKFDDKDPADMLLAVRQMRERLKGDDAWLTPYLVDLELACEHAAKMRTHRNDSIRPCPVARGGDVCDCWVQLYDEIRVTVTSG